MQWGSRNQSFKIKVEKQGREAPYFHQASHVCYVLIVVVTRFSGNC
jgi:hypothetical protein